MSRMAQRVFVDDSGTRWKVWEVRPEWAERRSGPERRVTESARPAGEKRRSSSDRRGRPDPTEVRIPLSAGLASGWLVFESDGEKRRLAPVPERWEFTGDADLAALCREARPVPGWRRRLVE
jgi:hypothetical protein